MREWWHDPWIERWSVYEQRSFEGVEPRINEEGERCVSFRDGIVTGYAVRTSNVHSQTPEDYEVELGPGEGQEAEALCEEFNRYELQGPLDPDFESRRERLKQLGHSFNSLHEGPPVARWPVKPARYLVHDGGVGWHPEPLDRLADDLDAVRAMIAEDEAAVYRVIDLDTGREVPFERSVVVEVGD